MTHSKLNKLVALGVFIITLGVYIRTLPSTVVFWDVGEFCAAAFSLQVPHPPGAPLFLLIARLTAMVPFMSDIAVRMHFISTFASAVTIMFLYLITVRFLIMMRGVPSTLEEKLTVYGGGAIAGLTLAFSKTFWFNGSEAEVYSLSMFFASGMFWLGLRWYERAEWSRSDVYLLLIAYMVGLSVGVHLLAVLTVFSIMLLVYFRWYEFSPRSFVRFGVVAIVVFGTIYPLIIKEFPSMLDGEIRGVRSDLFSFIPIAAIGGAIYGIYYAHKRKNRRLAVALLSFLFIVIGFSTYVVVYIRASAQPPMNENDPSTVARLVSYLNREQYGSQPFFKRRWDQDPEKVANFAKYSSDADFMWEYQLKHMYFRYFGWNFVGSAGDVKESGVDWSKTWGIPLLLGLFGFYEHWRKDPKMAFVNTTFFLMMGLILVMYFNMQEPQPRERDYFYTGSFFAFCIWIGIAVTSIIDFAREKLRSPASGVLVASTMLVVTLILSPLNLFRMNFKEADRKGNYIAWDYSYNLLQSIEPDGILFTNGDNDTFPLWYLQDVEGVRRDVRIVNLSLLNTNWYIKQLKHEEPYGAKKVAIRTSDVDIERIGPMPWQQREMELPVTREVIQRASEEAQSVAVLDTSVVNSGKIRFTLAPTIQFGNNGFLRVQDIMVYDIITSSGWQRPIYFAMTVSDDGKIGLRDYMQLRGLAFRLTPRRGPYYQNLDLAAIEAHLYTDVKEASLTPSLGFRWRGLQDSTVYYDEDSRRLVMSNYRNLFLTLSEQYFYTKRDQANGLRSLDRMEEVIPRHVSGMDPTLKYRVGLLYAEAGRNETSESYFREVVDEVTAQRDAYLSQPLTQFNPLIVLFYTQLELNLFDEAQELLRMLTERFGSDAGISGALQQLQGQLMMKRQQNPPPDTAR